MEKRGGGEGKAIPKTNFLFNMITPKSNLKINETTKSK